MAITGSGTKADPYIVHDWSEFLVICNDGDKLASQYTKFANPDREITGSGTQQSPFIVSTFEEMLEKTHASYIYQVELINAETKLYH